MQPHVSSFAGLASTVVGLSCYALSSSFNHLFGRWNLLKSFVYSAFSIIICLLILFAKKWARSRSLLFKAHMACLVLIATTVYSSYLDKKVKGKPDTYDLISCAAFAVMSLSLSRQTKCGCEVDLLYFFLGALIAQLMKIKLLLGVIGVGFSYFLVILRSSLHAPPESVHLRFQDQYHVVVQVDSNSQEAVQVDLDSQQANIDTAHIMPQLTACIDALKTNNWKLIDMLSKYVEEHTVDSNYKDHIPIDNNLVVDVLGSDIIDNLHEAVKLTLAAGFEKECCDIYSSCRREYLSDCLVGLRRHLPHIDRMETIQEYRIRIWIKTFDVAMRFLFPTERRLCERVFLGFTAAADLAFREVCREFMTRQLNLANSFAVERPTFFKAPKVLPRILGVLKTLHDLIQEYESLFYGPSSNSIRNESLNTWKRLEKATKDIFKELEDRICRDEAMADIPGGLYPISCDVMGFFSGVCEAWNTPGLEKAFEEHPMLAAGDGTSFSLSTQLTRIIELLDSHLEVKYKNCASDALRYVFKLNNTRYIEQKAIECQLRMSTIFQDGTITELNAKVEGSLEDYHRSSWNEVIEFLMQGGDKSETAELIEKNLKLESMHRDICRVQSKWFVLDEQLRKEIIGYIKKIFWPAYGNFVRNYPDVFGPHTFDYMTSSMSDINNLIDSLFRG